MVVKTIKNTLALATCVLCLFSVSTVHAQDGISTGGVTLFPTLGVSYEYDNNITLSRHQGVSSGIGVISPGIQIVRASGAYELAFQYELEYAEYFDSPIDDYTDQFVSLDWRYKPNARWEFSSRVGYDKGHDARGTGLREGDLGLLEISPDEWEDTNIAAVAHYGAEGSKGAVEVEVGAKKLRYTNNRSVTRLLDFDSSYLAGRFLYRIQPKTEALIEVRQDWFDYTLSSFDGTDTRVLAGIRWNATAKTSGRILAGYQERKFDSAATPDFDGEVWEIGVNWAPKTYSTFDLSYIRGVDHTNALSAYRVSEDVVLNWTHHWASRFNTNLELGYMQTDLEPNVRSDDLVFGGVSMQYEFRPWMHFGAAYRWFDRESSDPEFYYDRELFQLTVEVSP